MKSLILAVLLAAATAIPAGAAQASKKPSLKGSKATAQQQNIEADKEDLTRIEDDEQLRRFVSAGLLVPLPENRSVRVDPRLEEQYRYCRPETSRFLTEFGKEISAKFSDASIQVNSAVRTIAKQRALRGSNTNAAPISGPEQSSHLTGATVDIAKNTLSRAELAWMRDYLRKKKAAGQILAVEEFRQTVFHVMVFNTYGTKAAEKEKAPAKKPDGHRPPKRSHPKARTKRAF